MHGTITLDDTPGGGLTVVIALPAAPEWSPLPVIETPLRPMPRRQEPAVTGTPKTRVLVVEDDPEMRRALSLNLTARGYQ